VVVKLSVVSNAPPSPIPKGRNQNDAALQLRASTAIGIARCQRGTGSAEGVASWTIQIASADPRPVMIEYAADR
jgi:hypothetical protein